MLDLELKHPLDGFIEAGHYGGNPHHAAAFTIRVLKDLSLVMVSAYAQNHDSFAERIRSVLGLVVPDPAGSYIAGTRVMISPEENKYFITTEGEARDVLSGRLTYALQEHGAVFEQSAAYVVLRVDGYHFEHILLSLTKNPDILALPVGKCQTMFCDDVDIILHRTHQDTHFLYIPRHFSMAIYRLIVEYCLPFGVRLCA
jgi:heterotetrameric sarcosine oxidase gamma subunit